MAGQGLNPDELAFGADDEAAYQRAAKQIVDGYARAGGERWTAEQLLHFKWGYLDGNLGRWTGLDLYEILMGLFPRKVVLDAEDLPTVVPEVRRFVEHLARQGLLGRGSDSPDELHEALDEVEADFAGAMRDTTRFGMVKSLVGGAADAGVDVLDEGALMEWLEAAGPALPAGIPDLPPLQPVPREALAEAAAQAPAVHRLGEFAAFVGEGRKLTAKGNLTLADGRELVDLLETSDRFDEVIGDRQFHTHSTRDLPGVDFVFRWARKSGFVKVQRGRVQRTKAGRAFGRDALADWNRAFEGLLALGVLRDRYSRVNWMVAPWAEDLDDAVDPMLVLLYAVREPLEIDHLSEIAWEGVLAAWHLDHLGPEQLERWQRLTDRDVRLVLRRLAELGAVTVADVVTTARDFGMVDESGGTAQLTPLGLDAVRRRVERLGLDAPVAGRFRGLGAGDLLDELSDLPDLVAREEARAWMAERDPAEAAGQLAAALVAEPGAARVSVAFAMLGELGDEGGQAVSTLAEEPALAGYAAVWLHDAGLPAPEVEPAAALLAAAGIDTPTAAAVAFADAVPPEQQLDVLERIRVLGDASAGPLLDAIGATHPDRKVAKAARKARFRLSSGGSRALR